MGAVSQWSLYKHFVRAGTATCRPPYIYIYTHTRIRGAKWVYDDSSGTSLSVYLSGPGCSRRSSRRWSRRSDIRARGVAHTLIPRRNIPVHTPSSFGIGAACAHARMHASKPSCVAPAAREAEAQRRVEAGTCHDARRWQDTLATTPFGLATATQHGLSLRVVSRRGLPQLGAPGWLGRFGGRQQFSTDSGSRAGFSRRCI